MNFINITAYIMKFFNEIFISLKQCGLNFIITCNYNSSDRQNYQTIMFDNKVLIRINKSKLTYFYSKWEFNKDVYCDYIFGENKNFRDKYNEGNLIINQTKDFLSWFENNRKNIGNLNISKKEALDIDDYLNDFTNKELTND